MLHMHVSVIMAWCMDDAYVYEMKCNFVEAKHLGCYKFDIGGEILAKERDQLKF